MICPVCSQRVTRTDAIRADRLTGRPGSAHAACLMLASITLAGKSQKRTRALVAKLGAWAREARR
jgi:hypothetical protein